MEETKQDAQRSLIYAQDNLFRSMNDYHWARTVGNEGYALECRDHALYWADAIAFWKQAVEWHKRQKDKPIVR